MRRHVLARPDRTKKSPARSALHDHAELDRLNRDLVPAMRADARELANEIWEIAEDESWVQLVVAQRVLGWRDPDPEFGDLTPLRMRFVLQCVADDLATLAPDRPRKR